MGAIIVITLLRSQSGKFTGWLFFKGIRCSYCAVVAEAGMRGIQYYAGVKRPFDFAPVFAALRRGRQGQVKREKG